MDEYEIFKFFCSLYVLLVVSFAGLYLYTMYTQYKNAHDKWYDINRENDIDGMYRLERLKRE